MSQVTVTGGVEQSEAESLGITNAQESYKMNTARIEESILSETVRMSRRLTPGRGPPQSTM